MTANVGRYQTSCLMWNMQMTALVADCMDRILELTGLLAEESQKWGLKINTKKTRIMPVTKKNGPQQQVFSRGNEIEIVHYFVYLGSVIG